MDKNLTLLIEIADRIRSEAWTPEDIETLKKMATDPAHPFGDAAAVLYDHYSYQGEEEESWKWADLARDLESPLMAAWDYEDAEQEIGEDDWEQEFQGYDDETEAP